MNRTDSSPGLRAAPIAWDADIVEGQIAAHAIAAHVGFGGTDLVTIATAVSEVARNEVARNIVEYASTGRHPKAHGDRQLRFHRTQLQSDCPFLRGDT